MKGIGRLISESRSALAGRTDTASQSIADGEVALNIVFSEVIGTAALVFGDLSLVANGRVGPWVWVVTTEPD